MAELSLAGTGAEIRSELRAWLADNVHDALRAAPAPVRTILGGQWRGGKTERDLPAWAQEWENKLAAERLICPQWPVEFGGRGMTPASLLILNEEFLRARAPRVRRDQGEMQVAPVVLAHGSEEQKQRVLPQILDGTMRFCQGFSEPDAGSDLASIRTRGVIEGDTVVITGQKVWTSRADLATHIYLMCRTDPAAPRHKGLSLVLVPLSDPGLVTRPLRQLSGAYGFFEVFLDGARAPVADVVGEVNDGWRVAMTLLAAERSGEATIQYVPFLAELHETLDLARTHGRTTDPVVRQRLARSFAEIETLRYGGLRIAASRAADKSIAPLAATNKLYWSELHRRLCDVSMDVLGLGGQMLPDRGSYTPSPLQKRYFYAFAEAIFAGTNQIQRNIIAERVLGLPK